MNIIKDISIVDVCSILTIISIFFSRKIFKNFVKYSPSYIKEYKKIENMCIEEAKKIKRICIRINQKGYLESDDCFHHLPLVNLKTSDASKNTTRVIEYFKKEKLIEISSKAKSECYLITPVFYKKYAEKLK